jgi:hypothetical protein
LPAFEAVSASASQAAAPKGKAQRAVGTAALGYPNTVIDTGVESQHWNEQTATPEFDWVKSQIPPLDRSVDSSGSVGLY